MAVSNPLVSGAGLPSKQPKKRRPFRIYEKRPSNYLLLIEKLFEEKWDNLSNLARGFIHCSTTCEDIVSAARLKMIKWVKSDPISCYDDKILYSKACTTTKNLCLDEIRRRKPKLWEYLPPIEFDQQIIEQAYSSEVWDRVWQAVESLPVRERQAIIAKYYLDLTELEAAELTEMSVPAFKSRLHRARELLRGTFAQEAWNFKTP